MRSPSSAEGPPAPGGYDLRVWIDGYVSPVVPVVLDPIAPDLFEDPGARRKTVVPGFMTTSHEFEQVQATVPTSTSGTIVIEKVNFPPLGGSTSDLIPRGAAWNVEPGTLTGRPFGLRLPFTGEGRFLEIHVFDSASSTWRRTGPATVSHADGWVAIDADGPGIHALFDSPPMPTNSSSVRCLASASVSSSLFSLGWILPLLLGVMVCSRRP